MSDLHDRIAKALGWPAADARSLSMQALRDLVRPVDPDLAAEMDPMIRSGAYVRGEPKKVALDNETSHVIKERQKLQAALKAIQARLKDPKNKAHEKELRARRDLLERKLSAGPWIGGRAHSTIQKALTFKIASTDPATMAPPQINKELDKLDAQGSQLGDEMIATGRGYERPSEYLKMTDPLALELRKNADRRWALRSEIEMRYGPGAPHHLPTGRGFGPRKK